MKLIVVGGGPAGMYATLQARELHAEVTLLESKRVGGTSINEGPAPVRLTRVGFWEEERAGRKHEQDMLSSLISDRS